jgi:WD40-like Beta Propeller Repeat
MLAMTATVLVATGCVAPGPEPSAAFSDVAVPPNSVPFEAAPLDGIAWQPDGRIVFGYLSEVNDATMGTHLWSIQPDGSAAGPMALDPGVACTRTETLAPLMLASGELSYQLRCTPGAKGPFTYRTGFAGVDAAGRSTTLMPLTDLPFIARQAAWSADGTRGLVGGGSVVCEGVALVDRTGIHPWSMRLGAGTSSFDLADFLTPSEDCTGTGNADLPAWSRDGTRVAFLASTAAVGVSGPARGDAAWSMYIVDGNLAGPAATLLDGIGDPSALQWSPDGRWLAMAGSVDGSEGVWLIESASGRPVRISNYPFWLDLAWSWDGSRIVGLRDETTLGGARAAEIVMRDVSSIVHPN